MSTPPPAAPPKPRRVHAGFAPFPHPHGEHSLGGFDVSMPNCPACGATTRLWFCFDVEADAQLAPLRVLWSLLPLVGCGNCGAWRYRHDYMLDADATELKLVKVWATPEELATIVKSDQPTLPRQSVALAETDTSNVDPALQVGGAPLFVGEPMAPRCVTCNEAMVFVATLARSAAFDPPLAVVGARHHFACMRCSALAVIAEAGI